MPCMHLGLHLVPWQGCGGKRGGGEEAYLAGGQQVVLGRKGPSLCCGQAAPGAWCGGASGRRGLRAGPLSLPSPPSRRLPPPLQRAPARGGSREARSPVAAPRRGLYSCQADGEELTLPTGLLPPTPPHPRRPPAAWRTLITRSAPPEPGQAGPAACCLLPRPRAGRPPSQVQTRDCVSGCPDGVPTGPGAQGRLAAAKPSPRLGPSDFCFQRGPSLCHSPERSLGCMRHPIQ